MSGWIKIHRKIMEHKDYFEGSFDRIRAWIDLLLLAEYRPYNKYVRGIKIEVKRGQVSMSVRELSERWKISDRTVRKFLKEMENEGQISIERSKFVNCINIANYELFQFFNGSESTQQNPNLTPYDTEGNFCNFNNSVEQRTQQKQITPYIYITKNTKERVPKGTPKKDELSFPASLKKIDYKRVFNLWNEVCVSLPKLKTFGKQRKEKVRLRLVEFEGNSFEKKITFAKMLFEKIENSNFCKGDSRSGWKANFDWLFSNETNWVKVLEGNYDNKQKRNEENRQDRRRAMEITATSADDYEEGFI